MKIGDIVRMKGSHVLMTVNSIEGTHVNCLWFTEDNELRAGMFHINALEPGK